MVTKKLSLLLGLLSGISIFASECSNRQQADKLLSDLYTNPSMNWKKQKKLIQQAIVAHRVHPDNIVLPKSPLRLAVSNNDAPFVRYLIENNANPCIDSDLRGSLLTITHSPAITDMILSAGESMNNLTVNNLCCALITEPLLILVYYKHHISFNANFLLECIMHQEWHPGITKLPQAASILVRLGVPLDTKVKNGPYKGHGPIQLIEKMLNKGLCPQFLIPCSRPALENSPKAIRAAQQELEMTGTTRQAKKILLNRHMSSVCTDLVLDYAMSHIPDSIIDELEKLNKDIEVEKGIKEITKTKK